MLSGVMGQEESKLGRGTRRAPWRRPRLDPEQIVAARRQASSQTKPQHLDKPEIFAAKKLIQEQPAVFLLNNLLMAIQLFSNYEKEMEEAREKLKASENKLNDKLLPEKSVLLPDVLREHFAERVRFTSNCKSDKNDQTVEPLRPIRIHVIYENVLVTEIDEARHYSSPRDLKIEHNFVLRETDHKGYARLEQLRALKLGLVSSNTDLSSIVENQDEPYSDESVYGPVNLPDEDEYSGGSNHEFPCNGSSSNVLSKIGRNDRVTFSVPRAHRSSGQQPSSSSGSTSNRSSPSSSSSGYTTTTYGPDSDSDSSGHSGAAQQRLRNGSRRWSSDSNCNNVDHVPSSCLKRVTYTYDGRIYDPRREPRPQNSQQRRIRDLKLLGNYDVVYVNGYRFAKHFDKAFRRQLAERMNFDQKTVDSIKRCDATLRLEKIAYIPGKNYIKIEQYEVVPSFTSPWPKWALGWADRPRQGWPTSEDCRLVEGFTCCLVPESSRPSSTNESDGSSHPLWKLDWSLSFPVAERHLETCLSASQSSVLTIALMLHKTFIKAVSPSIGFETEHIRNALFWMVERQPDWPEQQMGHFTMLLLELLHNNLQQRTMRDYFVEERNLFANVNRNNLLHAQKQLKRIIENPVMYIFHAMEKIQYAQNDYPPFDYQRLLQLLVTNELYLINPNLLSLEPSEPEVVSPLYGRRDQNKNDFWSDAKQYDTIVRKRNAKTLIQPQHAHDSVFDIQERCQPLTRVRLSKILSFFAHHFLKMAQCCQQIGAARPKRAYLNQTKLLADLLIDDPEQINEAKEILQQVHALRMCPLSQDSPGYPETPKRNTDPPVFTVYGEHHVQEQSGDTGL